MVFFCGNQSPNLKNLPIKVKKFVTKSGIARSDFKSPFLALKANKKIEVITAKPEIKSPNQAKATLENTVVTKSRRKFRDHFCFGVSAKIRTA